MPENDSAQPTSNALNILFDLRMIIAVLFVIYGVICVIWGAAFTPSNQLAKADGFNVNLVAGIGMIVVSGLFVWWALAKPITQNAIASSQEESEQEARKNL
ncbi:hypothetical protein ACFOYW_12370 [Gryllotalpicola reticulitermitis]|uniref:Uncharacterized protein n=1 Tax=Gryllotalpicola reticulitermitis TaxID=1184153 RepID=A0ABV8Q783_9MICO